MHAPAGTKALAQGLAIVRILSEAAQPLSATAVAERLGVSVSTASRALGALAAAGYVIKPDYHHFAPSIGVVTLAANAREHFGIAAAARQHYSIQARTTGWLWAVGTVHDAQAIYLLRVGPQHDAVELAVGRFPLHLSIIGLRTLLELTEADALERLRHSRRLYGWDRPQPQIPEQEEDLLASFAPPSAPPVPRSCPIGAAPAIASPAAPFPPPATAPASSVWSAQRRTRKKCGKPCAKKLLNPIIVHEQKT